MKILVYCEESQTITKAFRQHGHSAYSCDLQPCSGGHPEWHLQPDHDIHSKYILYDGGWDLVIAHPPCPYLTITANKWFKEQPARKSGALVGAARMAARTDAIKFAELIWNAPVKRMCIENPVGVLSTQSKLGKPSQIIQPWQFGHPEPKKTCLWLRGLPLLQPTEIVKPEYHVTASGKRVPKWFFYADRKQNRASIRSKTFPGIGEAMATQWTI